MKMLHVTIQTNHFEEELKFYQEIVGLNIIRDMGPMGRNIIFLGNAEGETEIEIIEKPDADHSGNVNLSIGFKTGDVFTKHEELAAQGIEVTPMISPATNVHFFFVKDPAGVNVQFM